jgi:hypothetical protein
MNAGVQFAMAVRTAALATSLAAAADPPAAEKAAGTAGKLNVVSDLMGLYGR